MKTWEESSIDSIKFMYRPVANLVWGGITIFNLKNKPLKIVHFVYSMLIFLVFGYGYMLTEIIFIMENKTNVAGITLTLCYFIAHTVGKILILYIFKIFIDIYCF